MAEKHYTEEQNARYRAKMLKRQRQDELEIVELEEKIAEKKKKLAQIAPPVEISQTKENERLLRENNMLVRKMVKEMLSEHRERAVDEFAAIIKEEQALE